MPPRIMHTMASLYLPPLHALFLSVISAPLLFGCNQQQTKSPPYVVAPSVISDEAHSQRKTFDIPMGEKETHTSQLASVIPVTTQQLYSLQQKQVITQNKYRTALSTKQYQSEILTNATTVQQGQQAQVLYRQANLTSLFAQRQLEIMQQQQIGIQRSLIKQRNTVNGNINKQRKTTVYDGVKGVRTGKLLTVRLSLINDSLLSKESLQQLDALAASIKKSKQPLQLIAYQANTNNLPHDQGISSHHINMIMVQLLKRGINATQLQKKITLLTKNSEKIRFLHHPYIDLVLNLS